MLSGMIAQRYGAGLPEHALKVRFNGSAGQSLDLPGTWG